MTIHTLSTSDGASCQIHSDGAHITSWIPAGGEERLYLSPRSAFGTGAAIRGGVPVIFPQFAAMGPFSRHGFARRSAWTALGEETVDAGKARFELRESAATLAEWPFAFRCELAVLLSGRELEIRLRVENNSERAFSFSAALHTYFSVKNLAAARLIGLEGARYLDSASGERVGVQAESEMAFAGEVDRIYPDGPQRLTLREANRSLTIAQRGFSDTVVWNPGAAKGGGLTDLEPEGWRKFVCVEAALIDPPVTLVPGGDWSGSQRLSA